MLLESKSWPTSWNIYTINTIVFVLRSSSWMYIARTSAAINLVYHLEALETLPHTLEVWSGVRVSSSSAEETLNTAGVTHINIASIQWKWQPYYVITSMHRASISRCHGSEKDSHYCEHSRNRITTFWDVLWDSVNLSLERIRRIVIKFSRKNFDARV